MDLGDLDFDINAKRFRSFFRRITARISLSTIRFFFEAGKSPTNCDFNTVVHDQDFIPFFCMDNLILDTKMIRLVDQTCWSDLLSSSTCFTFTNGFIISLFLESSFSYSEVWASIISGWSVWSKCSFTSSFYSQIPLPYASNNFSRHGAVRINHWWTSLKFPWTKSYYTPPSLHYSHPGTLHRAAHQMHATSSFFLLLLSSACSGKELLGLNKPNKYYRHNYVKAITAT